MTLEIFGLGFFGYSKVHYVHSQNECQRKGVHFSDYPQSQVSKGSPIVLTAFDHQALVAKGI